MEYIQLKNINKIYKTQAEEVKALDEITLSIKKGEFVIIMGTSGSGKSTLLHILAGIDRPSSGSIFVDGTDITQYTEKQLVNYRRKKVSMIYQFYNLIDILNVEDNITLPLLLDSQKVNKNALNDIIENLHLTDRRYHYPNQLSGGQQQRVAIARSLLAKPAILLADEPTGNLDSKNSLQTIQLLKKANTQYGQTIVMVTHDEKLTYLANRVLIIQDGRIIEDTVKS